MLQQLNQDWEHESNKDFVYLLEEENELRKGIQKELNRQPALITVIDKDKILEKRYEHKYYALPF